MSPEILHCLCRESQNSLTTNYCIEYMYADIYVIVIQYSILYMNMATHQPIVPAYHIIKYFLNNGEAPSRNHHQIQ